MQNTNWIPGTKSNLIVRTLLHVHAQCCVGSHAGERAIISPWKWARRKRNQAKSGRETPHYFTVKMGKAQAKPSEKRARDPALFHRENGQGASKTKRKAGARAIISPWERKRHKRNQAKSGRESHYFTVKTDQTWHSMSLRLRRSSTWKLGFTQVTRS